MLYDIFLALLIVGLSLQLLVDGIKLRYKIFKNFLNIKQPFFQKPFKLKLNDNLYCLIWYKYTYVSNLNEMSIILDRINTEVDKQIKETGLERNEVIQKIINNK